ncbi:hypothetical protein ABZ078_00240 [Streptomyces sp. NPDC006385]
MRKPTGRRTAPLRDADADVRDAADADADVRDADADVRACAGRAVR